MSPSPQLLTTAPLSTLANTASTMAAGETYPGIIRQAALDVVHLSWVAVKLGDTCGQVLHSSLQQ